MRKLSSALAVVLACTGLPALSEVPAAGPPGVSAATRPRGVQNVVQDQWTWVGGSNSADQAGVYGTKGVPASANVPGARVDSVSWTDRNGAFWLFGGLSIAPHTVTTLYYNDLWRWDGAKWTWMSGSNTPNQPGVYGTKGVGASGNTPGGRYGPTGWIDQAGNLWLFGGYGYDAALNQDPGDLNDLWKWDGSKWTWVSGSSTRDSFGVYGTKGVAAAGNVPGARSYAVSAVDPSGNAWLFGGYGRTESDLGDLNDLWRWDGANWTWLSGSKTVNEHGVYGTKGVASAANVPGGRRASSGRADGNGRLWVFGGVGYDGGTNNWEGHLNDLWKWNGSSWTWMSGSSGMDDAGNYGTKGVPSATNVPPARVYSASWMDASGDLWIFGGGMSKFNDLWRWDGTNWTWVSGSNLIHQQGTYGTKGVAAATNVPGARDTFASWLDRAGNLWLFGGSGFAAAENGYLNDLWAFGSGRPETSGVCITNAAATLLVPEWEVSLNGSTGGDIPAGGVDTTVEVSNYGTRNVMTHVTIWSRRGNPVLTFNVPMRAGDHVLFSMRDVMNGQLNLNGATQSGPTDLCGDTTYRRFPNPDSVDASLTLSRYAVPAFAGSFRQLVWDALDETLDDATCSGGTSNGTYSGSLRGSITIDVVNFCTNKSPADAAYYVNDALATDWPTGTPNVLTGAAQRVPSLRTPDAPLDPLSVELVPFTGADWLSEPTFYRSYLTSADSLPGPATGYGFVGDGRKAVPGRPGTLYVTILPDRTPGGNPGTATVRAVMQPSSRTAACASVACQAELFGAGPDGVPVSLGTGQLAFGAGSSGADPTGTAEWSIALGAYPDLKTFWATTGSSCAACSSCISNAAALDRVPEVPWLVYACSPGTAQLTAPSMGGGVYFWRGPGDFTSTDQNPTITLTGLGGLQAEGTYWVSWAPVGSRMCKPLGRSYLKVVAELPAPTTGNDGPKCAGGTVQLWASWPGANAVEYSWTGPNGFSSSAQNPTVPIVGPSSAGWYNLKVTANGCTSATGTTYVNVTPSPTVLSTIPADGAAGVTAGSLYWNATDATAYDVLFDTVNPPLKTLATGTSLTSVSMPVWFPNNTYYWRVSSQGTCGSVLSPVYSFTTGACAFSGVAPDLIAPSDGQGGLPVHLSLAWQYVPGTSHYDVYIGTTDPPAARYATVTDSMIAVAVAPGTTYYWRVKAVPVCGNGSPSMSAVRKFTTAANGYTLTGNTPSFMGRWSFSTLSVAGSGFTGSTLAFIGSNAGAGPPFLVDTRSATQLSGWVAPNGAPAGVYDVGITDCPPGPACFRVEMGRLLRSLVVLAFTDVPESQFFFESSSRVVDAGIMEPDFDFAAPGPQFVPTAVVTRALMAEYMAKSYQWIRTRTTALPSATCTPDGGGGSTDFPDVPCSHPDWLAIHWIKTWGITAGANCVPGPGLCYLPDTSITRGQMVTFLSRLKYGPEGTGTVLQGFLDGFGANDPGCSAPYPACSGWTDPQLQVPAATWPHAYVNVAYQDRLTNGCAGTTPPFGFCTGTLVTRGQMAEFLGRAVGLVPTP